MCVCVCVCVYVCVCVCVSVCVCVCVLCVCDVCVHRNRIKSANSHDCTNILIHLLLVVVQSSHPGL